MIALVPRPEFVTLRVTGPDRKSWLGGLLTADILGVREGMGAWSLALSRQGKIIADILVVEDAHETLWLGGTEASSGSLAKYLEGFLVMEDVELEEVTGDYTWGLAFPDGEGPSLSGASSKWAAWCAFHSEVPYRAAFVVPRQAEAELYQELLARGDMRQVSDEGDWADLRLDHAIPLFGQDFTEQDSPHQAGIERGAVDWGKGCYLGQEAVCMQEMRGKVKRRLMLLEGDGLSNLRRAVKVGDPVLDESGAKVGEVTSVGVRAKPVSQPERVAFARINAPHFEADRALFVGENPVRPRPIAGPSRAESP